MCTREAERSCSVAQKYVELEGMANTLEHNVVFSSWQDTFLSYRAVDTTLSEKVIYDAFCIDGRDTV